MLLLPGEGVRQPLHGLGSVLCHLGLDGVCDFLEHGVDLFQEAPGFVNVIQLQKRPDGQSVSPAEPTVPPHRDGTAWGQGARPGRPSPHPGSQINPQTLWFQESPAKSDHNMFQKTSPERHFVFKTGNPKNPGGSEEPGPPVPGTASSPPLSSLCAAAEPHTQLSFGERAVIPRPS